MKLLVTGGNGQLGSSLKKISGEYPAMSFIFTDIPEADITDRECMSELIGRHRPDVIVNCAAYTAVDRAESDAETAALINTTGPEVLAGLSREHGIKLIHISTDYVFDGRACRPLNEDHPAAPSGVYGRTKLEGERAVQKAGCDAAVIRTSWLYSEYGNNFVKTMLRLSAEKDEINVVYDQTGTPTYAPDLAKAIIHIAEKGTSGYEIYHYSNEGVCSWYDFAKDIFEQNGIHIKVNPITSDDFPTAAQRPAYSVLAKDKIKATGAEVPYWKDSLKKCIAALKSV